MKTYLDQKERERWLEILDLHVRWITEPALADHPDIVESWGPVDVSLIEGLRKLNDLDEELVTVTSCEGNGRWAWCQFRFTEIGTAHFVEHMISFFSRERGWEVLCINEKEKLYWMIRWKGDMWEKLVEIFVEEWKK